MTTLGWLSLPVLVLLTLSSIVYSDNEEHKSIDQIIMEAAPKAEMFDVLHMSPEGEVMVMVELDIMMSLKQYMELKRVPEVTRSKRKALRATDMRWRDCTVYFQLSGDLQGDRNVIREAMAEWQKYTCLVFKEASSSTTDKIIFQDGEGCFSRLGRVGGPQIIGLARTCFQKGVVVHEIGHAIGWIHEQARPDRDAYIRVNYNRIPQPWHPQFDKFDSSVINLYNIEYDYRSVMHYSGNALAERTIETLDPAFQDVIGQRKGLSFRDIKLANAMYDCAKIMRCRARDCSSFSEEAFQNKNCECVCPGNDTHPAVPCLSQITTKKPPATTAKITTTTKFTKTTSKPEPMDCADLRPDCPQLATLNECTMSPTQMFMYCKKTCNFCDIDDSSMCVDFDPSCPLMAQANFCKQPQFVSLMSMKCKKSCKLCTPTDPCQIHREWEQHFNKGSKLSHFCSLFLRIASLITIQRLAVNV